MSTLEIENNTETEVSDSIQNSDIPSFRISFGTFTLLAQRPEDSSQ
jgi:hypothetical protein